MKLFADYHTHTKYSDGHGTISENVQAALNKGLHEVAITDHGPRNIGTGIKNIDALEEILTEVARVNDLDPGIKVLAGIEACVVSSAGDLEISQDVIEKLDLLIVGLHPYFFPEQLKDIWHFVLPNHLGRFNRRARERVKNTNTKALVEAVNNCPVDIVSHPNLMMPVELDELARACTSNDTAMEINTGHKYSKEEIVQAALKAGTRLVINSDAHSPERVGDLDSGLALVKQMGFPPEQVINLDLESKLEGVL
ncbi:PHP domain-containing protein [Desulfolucanica intricata]|uniref:PHP domain-containing protein n=1 Tax=Desulfolucanica intricata TaxID=1285191 RepID=UPI00082FFA16|nr:PHP domain-containing protein [Desulfolucanica intricata]